MNLLDKLEKKFSKFTINNLVYYLLAGQAILFVANYANPRIIDRVFFNANLFLNGEWWRILTFIFYPLNLDPVMFAFFIYFQFFVGNSLKNKWGAFKLQIYFLVIFLATIVTAFLNPNQAVSGSNIFLSISLAFYYLFPEVKFYIFFLIPVKAKWIGLITWLFLIGQFVTGNLMTKILTFLSISNFLLFFGKDLWLSFKMKLREQNNLAKKEESGLKCNFCKETDKIFYYCKECIPPVYYCEDHINNHEHKKSH